MRSVLTGLRRLGISLTAGRAVPVFCAMAVFAVVDLTNAHNNPSFREDLLTVVEIDPASEPNSEPFNIHWPEKTVQLIWRVVDVETSTPLTLTLHQQGVELVQISGLEATTDRFQGEGFSLTVDVDVSAFAVEVYAKVLDRSLDKDY